ncbi:Uncharacterised protein [uncultured Eubacterium sp.]|nr:Uncharacterised protein [uncultured Eubacterium sp.]
MKHLFSLLLAVTMILSTAVISFGESDGSYSFDITAGDDYHITGAVIVENGTERRLTEQECVDLLKNTPSDETVGEIPPIENEGISPRTAFYYKFVPSSKTEALGKTKRVSALYQNAAEIYVTSAMTYERSVTETGGITVNASVSKAVDAAVTASYNVVKKATSSMSSEVTGKFIPSKKYKYSAVGFRPKVATVKGVFQYRQEWQGDDTVLLKYNMTWKYPVSGKNGALDGVYLLLESNTSSGFPALA